MPSFSIRTFLVILIYILSGTNNCANASGIDTTAWLDGRTLFKTNCTACHNPAIAQTGPALAGVTQRWNEAGDYQGKTGQQWLYAWIRNWNDVVSAGYPYAVKVQNYSPSQMSVFPALSDRDINHILLYVENSQTQISAVSPAAPDKETNWDTIILSVLFVLVAAASAVLFMISQRNKH